jgi:ketosteroid isomerase-like protein
MKTTVCLIALFLLAATAQKPTTESPLHSMVATERAFSQASADKGTRDSFLMFIAEDGILFRPSAVLGKKWLLEHPVPLVENRPLLSWQPTFAYMAAAGDMGYTFGPWEYKQSINDQKPSAFGHFITMWKKQADGAWRFAIDLGVSHPQSAKPQTPWVPAPTAKSKTNVATVPVAASREALLSRDREFSQESAKQGSVAAFTKYAAEDVRLFRNKHLPFEGKRDIAAALEASNGVLTWQPESADASRSGDLGFTYGRYEVKTDGALTAKGNYMRFWKKLDGVWRVVVDVDDPLPLTEKSQ